MAQLAGGETQQPSPDHAMLLDLAFSTEPLVRNGYEFRYTLINAGNLEGTEGRYQITATPVEFGKTGSRSFFTDQTAVLRFTTENRPSNADDPPLD
jgi:oxalate decarboxylase/phosphoglucose isomerase-like protein (cupin superfamily)